MSKNARALSLVAASFSLVFFLAPTAYACQDKTDCSGNEICCFGAMGGQDNLTMGGRKPEGYCAPAKVCASDSGVSVIHNDGAECPPGQSIQVKQSANGALLKGCFND